MSEFTQTQKIKKEFQTTKTENILSGIKQRNANTVYKKLLILVQTEGRCIFAYI